MGKIRCKVEGVVSGIPDLVGTTWCDVGGGEGALLTAVLQSRAHLQGVVYDLSEVVATSQARIGNLRFAAGDMFVGVPTADVYILKHILHDWSDDECRKILANIRQACSTGANLLVGEWVISDTSGFDFSKVMDIHMMCVSTGRQRTLEELAALLHDSGWALEKHFQTPGVPLSVVRAISV